MTATSDNNIYKRIFYIFFILGIFSPINAQRYTGWGRGVGIDNSGDGMSYFIPVVLAIMLILCAIVYLCELTHKIKNWLVGTPDSESNSQTNKKIRKAIITEEDYKVFKKCWLYTDFIKHYGKIKEIRQYTNSYTRKTFKACIIPQGKRRVLFIGFATSLGELTMEEISEREEELKVGLTEKGNYKLYNYKMESWEIIEFEDTEIKEIQEISKPSTVKEKVVDFNALKIEIENKIKEVNKPIAQLSTNKSFNINSITPNQRRATFGLIAYLGKRQFESNQEDADKIINTYAEILQISKEDYNFIMSGIQFSMFFEFFCDIEKIKIDEYWNFLFKAWRELINKDTGKRKLLYYKLYKTMKKALYFTDEEIDAVLQGKDIHKYNH